MKTTTKIKRYKTKVKRNAKRFFTRFAYRFLSKLLELILLGAIGYSLGLRLVRY